MSVYPIGKPVNRVFLSAAADAAALIAGFLLATLTFLTFLAAFAEGGGPVFPLLILWIPWLLWLFVGSAAAENSWRGAAKRIGFLVTATGAAFVAGFLLGAFIVLTFVAGFDVIARGGSLLMLLVTLLILPFAGAATASVWLARRSGISRPWLAWFLVGAVAFGLAWVTLFALASAFSWGNLGD